MKYALLNVGEANKLDCLETYREYPEIIYGGNRGVGMYAMKTSEESNGL